MSAFIKLLLRLLLRFFYRVRVEGYEHYRQAGAHALIVANHTSFLDGVLLTLFLPERLTFAVNTQIARIWWARIGLMFVDFFTLDPANPFSLRGLIRHARAGRRIVIFPEGRITITGALMKIYHGPALVADRAHCVLLSVRIEGPQYTPFSRLRVRPRWFPRVTLTFLPPRRLNLPAAVRGRARRRAAGRQLAELMSEMMFVTSHWRRTLLSALLDAKRTHGAGREIAEDIDRLPANYRALIVRSLVLGRALARATVNGERVGLLLPNALATLYAVFGLSARGRLPAPLDPGWGGAALREACTHARIGVVYTARRYVRALRLEALVESLGTTVSVRYLEDVRDTLTPMDWLSGYAQSVLASWFGRDADERAADSPAVLFLAPAKAGGLQETLYSHAQLLAGCQQLAARAPFGAQEALLAVLPPADPLGFLTGSLLPLMTGMRVFLYPVPRHHRVIPEMAYGLNLTVLFASDELLARYGEQAHPYDFQSMRYVFVSAHGLREATRRVWAEKFGLRLLEVYGRADLAPVLAVNSPVDYQLGRIGRLMPGLEMRLARVDGADNGGWLTVRGPGIALSAPRTEGWVTTGDRVTVDRDGYLQLAARRPTPQDAGESTAD
jgi:acyl-[acyl-carrier-protein]-phospholipid O-acyltransferase/long-chain-fatty-acid--[acyl-carrier-protein] ligase